MRVILKHLSLVLLLGLVCMLQLANAQEVNPVRPNRTGNPPVQPTISTDGRGNPVNPKRRGSDTSLRHRDPAEDSITIYYRYLDSTRIHYLDNSINDFSTRFPLPYHYVHNGNLGNAARSYLFEPRMKTGFDIGFHAFDVYRFKIEETKIYQTTRPYTELGYMLGSKAEQMIHILHTQNKGTNLNFGFEYRFINAPGVLRNQNANHNNFRFHTYYNSNNRRYSMYLVVQNNRLKSSENGGLVDETAAKDLSFSDPFELATRLGNSKVLVRSPFNTTITTGHDYKDNTILVRQQYDLGQKDSLVTDSSVYKLFYPRLRLQHTFTYTKSRYEFQDESIDTANYRNYLGFPFLTKPDKIEFVDAWRVFNNELSLISYPQKTNQNQFLKVGMAVQNLRGQYRNKTELLYNVSAIAEYRNRTKNKRWDVEASGQLYLNGFNSGDYAAQLTLKRLLSRNVGYLELGFENVNRTPSAIFFGRTSFPVATSATFSKENITRLLARYENPKFRFRLTGEYFLVSNYSFFSSFYDAEQESTLFNVLHVTGEKVFKLSKHINLYSEVHLQQPAGNPPLNLPQFFTRNRVAYEGNLGFKNLDLSTGLEVRYHTPYKADNYSPIPGQFVFQDTATLSNKPDVNLFVHFSIKTFKAFIRLENINSIGKHYNFVSSHYAYTTLWFRLGIWWGFVN
jgi:hypothetical protein